MGAVISTLCAETIIASIQLYGARKIVTKEWFLSGWKYWISSIIMFLGVYFIGNLVEVTLIGTSIQIIVGVIIYMAMLIFLKDDFINIFLIKLKLKKA